MHTVILLGLTVEPLLSDHLLIGHPYWAASNQNPSTGNDSCIVLSLLNSQPPAATIYFYEWLLNRG